MRATGRIALLGVLLLAASCAAPGEANDPLEPLNRGTFWVNEKLDHYALEPVARVYHRALPDAVERSISRFFTNLLFPVRFVNNVLQAKLGGAVEETGRFLVNSTVGVAGLFDPAKAWGLEAHPEDFGQTLGAWGIGPGPYLVLPLLGPSSLRDAPSLAVDAYAGLTPFAPIDPLALAGAYAVYGLNERAQVLELVAESRHTALDYYVFVRNAYAQRRRAAVEDRSGTAPSNDDQEDLYGDVTQHP